MLIHENSSENIVYENSSENIVYENSSENIVCEMAAILFGGGGGGGVKLYSTETIWAMWLWGKFVAAALLMKMGKINNMLKIFPWFPDILIFRKRWTANECLDKANNDFAFHIIVVVW